MPTLRTLHRWLAPIVFLQMLAWLISGIFFSWNNFRRAARETPPVQRLMVNMPPDPLKLPVQDATTSIAHLLDTLKLRSFPTESIRSVQYRVCGNRQLYDVQWINGAGGTFDANSADPFLGIGEIEASELAMQAAGRGAKMVEWRVQDRFDIDYPSFHLELPVYRALLEGPSGKWLCLISPRTGNLIVKMNPRQRINRRMYSWLHIMEYSQSRAGRMWGYGLLMVFGGLMTVSTVCGIPLVWKRS
ncbi:MAG TPA: hypothetical protein VGK99_08585 [Acidobacteriota bacterium]|jgi:hypothetical protein